MLLSKIFKIIFFTLSIFFCFSFYVLYNCISSQCHGWGLMLLFCNPPMTVFKAWKHEIYRKPKNQSWWPILVGHNVVETKHTILMYPTVHEQTCFREVEMLFKTWIKTKQSYLQIIFNFYSTELSTKTSYLMVKLIDFIVF